MKKLIPEKLWSDTFIDEGCVGLGFDKDDDFSSECYKVLSMKCVKAHWDDNGNLQLTFKKEN